MSEEIANQSEPVAQETIETAPVTVEAPATTQEAPKGMTVKYNKEDRFVSDEELPAYVQKGLNYDKVSDRAKEADTLQQNLERVAKFYGYENHSDYMNALDEHEKKQQIQKEAEKLGVDESVIRDHLNPMKEQLNKYEQAAKDLEAEKNLVKINTEITDLKSKYPDFEQYQDKVFDLAINDGYKLEAAYKIATYEDKLATIAKQTEADTIKKIQQNGAAATGSLGAEGAEHKTGFAALSLTDQRKMIEEVKQGKRTSFD
jgi:predicted transcriptional regulator with HTH domain